MRPEAVLSGPRIVDGSLPQPALWVDSLVGSEGGDSRSQEGLALSLRKGPSYSCLSLSQPGTDEMDILTFQQTVADAYRAVLGFTAAERVHPVRLWAFVPRIHVGYGSGLDRYMAFNAGRFSAFSAWLGGREGFGRALPTASAVGTHEASFHLHCLASREAGEPVDNPRQVPSYRYSRRFGPLPPCFARATRLRGEGTDLLLVGGTASIRGEESVHIDDIDGQISETLCNLASVVRSASLEPSPGAGEDPTLLKWLSTYKELRVYYREVEHRERILSCVCREFTGLERVEMRQAELCRAELLVEIEGLAELRRA